MVDESVDHRGGHDVVTEDLAPAAEGPVACHDQRGVLVAGPRPQALSPLRKGDSDLEGLPSGRTSRNVVRMTERICSWCGVRFIGTAQQKYCSGACRRAPWDAAHRAERLGYWRARYWHDHAAQAERARNWYWANRDAALANSRDWAAANRDRKNFAQRLRRARQAAASGEVSFEDWCGLLDRHGRRCAYCGAEGEPTVDHRTPLARGGSNRIDNLLPACRSCNLRKGTKDELEFRALLALEALMKVRRLREDAAPYSVGAHAFAQGRTASGS